MVFAVFALPILLRLVKKKRAAGLSLFSLFSHRCFSVSHTPCAVTSIYQLQIKHFFHIVTSHSRLHDDISRVAQLPQTRNEK